jgi:hypothetical protein
MDTIAELSKELREETRAVQRLYAVNKGSYSDQFNYKIVSRVLE